MPIAPACDHCTGTSGISARPHRRLQPGQCPVYCASPPHDRRVVQRGHHALAKLDIHIRHPRMEDVYPTASAGCWWSGRRAGVGTVAVGFMPSQFSPSARPGFPGLSAGRSSAPKRATSIPRLYMALAETRPDRQPLRTWGPPGRGAAIDPALCPAGRASARDSSSPDGRGPAGRYRPCPGWSWHIVFCAVLQPAMHIGCRTGLVPLRPALVLRCPFAVGETWPLRR